MDVAHAERAESGDSMKGICVAVKRGKTSRIECTSSEELMPALKDSSLAWVNFVVGDISVDGEKIATSLGFSQGIVTNLLSSYQFNYDDRDTELGIRIPAVSTEGVDVKIYPIIILIKKGILLSLHERAITRFVRFTRYATTLMKKMEARPLWEDQLTILLWRIIDENNAKNFDHLREIEEQADVLVKQMMDPKTPRELIGPHIYKMKHALIVYLDALWATLDVINTLRYGDAEVLTDDPELLERITALSADVTTQISISEHMSEVLASGLEVLQSIYNNQLQILNNRMALVAAWLAVLGTAFLVPNTIATVFSTAVGAGLDPVFELVVLVLSTVLSGAGAYAFIKHKGIIPKHAD